MPFTEAEPILAEKQPFERWAFALCSVAILLLIIASGLVEQHLRQQLKKDVQTALQAVVDSEQRGLRVWFGQQRLLIRTWADQELMQQSAQQLSTKVSAEGVQQAQTRLQKWFKGLPENPYQNYLLLTPKGQVLSSGKQQQVGKFHPLGQQKSWVAQVFKGDVKFVALPLQAPFTTLKPSSREMFITAPLKGLSPPVLLALHIKPDQAFPPLLTESHLGQTGETYLLNRQGLMLSASRFEDQLHAIHLLKPGQGSALNLMVRNPGVNLLNEPNRVSSLHNLPLTPMAAEVVAGHSGQSLQPYRDYRGVLVVGAWVWDEELGLGIATEQDASEAFAGLYQLEWWMYGFKFFAIFLLLGLSVLFGRQHLRLLKATSELHSRETRYHLLFENAPDAIVLLKDGRIESGNQAACRLLGLSRSELVGHRLDSFAPLYQPHGRSSVHDLNQQLEEAQSNHGARFEWRFQVPGGTAFQADVRLSSLSLYGQHFVQAVLRERSQHSP